MINRKLIIIMILATLLLLVIFLSEEKLLWIKDIGFPDREIQVIGRSPLKDIERDEKIKQAKYTSDEFQAGMNILIYGKPDLVETKNIFQSLRSLGINSVALNFPIYQSSLQADEVTTSPENTPDITELREIIEQAHDSGLVVMIRPIMDEQVFLSSNKWRGQINPKNPDKWFDSYQALILNYASLAESTGTKSLNIGTEFNSMQNQYQDRWIELIENVRRVYDGELLYSFNYDSVAEIPFIEFVGLLDYVGIDAYFPLELPDNASVEMLEEEWRRQIVQLEEVVSQQSIIVTEVGILPIAGAYGTPYAWNIPNGIYDPQAQANYYEATYNIWEPKADGIYWWVIMPGQGENEISFSPLNSPTEEVIRKHFLE